MTASVTLTEPSLAIVRRLRLGYMVSGAKAYGELSSQRKRPAPDKSDTPATDPLAFPSKF